MLPEMRWLLVVLAVQTVAVVLVETVVLLQVVLVVRQVRRPPTWVVLHMRADLSASIQLTEVFKAHHMPVVMRRRQVVLEEMVLLAGRVELQQVHLREV
jgi:hypothetical protein